MAAVRPPKPAPMMMTWMPVEGRGVFGGGEGKGGMMPLDEVHELRGDIESKMFKWYYSRSVSTVSSQSVRTWFGSGSFSCLRGQG